MVLDYLVEAITPNRRVRNRNHFWERYRSNIMKRDEIQDVLNRADTPEERARLESRLEDITKQNFDKYASNYFEYRSPVTGLARYGALGAGVLGGITAGGAIFGLAAGGPLALLGGVALGLGYLAYGAIANLASDAVDATRASAAIDGRLEHEHRSTGILGYVKRTAQGIWNLVSAPFRKSTYKQWPALLEGLGTNAVTVYGGAAIMQYLGTGILGAATPYAQVACMGQAFTSFYRGRKKFDDIVIGHVLKESRTSFLEQIVAGEAQIHHAVQRSLTRPNVIPIEAAYDIDPPVYAALTRQETRGLEYVAPRRVA